jgi:hypothetical protein
MKTFREYRYCKATVVCAILLKDGTWVKIYRQSPHQNCAMSNWILDVELVVMIISNSKAQLFITFHVSSFQNIPPVYIN